MARTLQSTGLAADLVALLMLDDDGVTLREWVNGWSSTFDGVSTWTDNNSSFLTVDDPVTVTSVTWKGESIPAFQTKANGNFNFYGIHFPATLALPDPWGTLIMGRVSSTTGSDVIYVGGSPSFETFNITDASRKFAFGSETASTTAISVDGTTLFSAGGNYDVASSGSYVYGLESGSLAADGTFTDSGFNFNEVDHVGGASGQGRVVGDYILMAWFNRALTTTEYQSLHDDPIGTLFVAAGGGGANISATVDAFTLSALASSVNAETHISAAVKAFSLSSSPSSIALGKSIQAAVDALVLTELAATIQTGNTLNTTPDALSIVPHASVISLSTNVQAALAALGVTERAAVVSVGKSVAAAFDVLSAQGLASSVALTKSIQATLRSIGIGEHLAIINNQEVVSLVNIRRGMYTYIKRRVT